MSNKIIQKKLNAAREERHLFICSTEYTILNAVNIELNLHSNFKRKSDLAIFARTDEVAKLRKTVDKSGVFESTYQFYFMNKINFFFLTFIVFFPKFSLNFFLRQKNTSFMKSNKYDVIISQNLLYAIIFRKFNKDSKIYLIEEGLSSYTGRTDSANRRSNSFHFFNKYILKADLKNFISGQYLYRPEMYNGEQKKVVLLPRLEQQKFNLYNKLFNYSDCDCYSRKQFIYLGVPFYGLKDLLIDSIETKPDFEDKCKSILDSILSLPSQNSFIYRKHPLEAMNSTNKKNNYHFDNCNNVWEMECQNKINNKHVIVSFFSTGAFSPKVLFDKEPYIIFLFKLLDVKLLNAEKLIHSLRSIYKNPEKVIIIESLEHYYDVVARIEKLKF